MSDAWIYLLTELKAFSGESETEGDSTNFPPGPVPINPLANAEGDSVRADQVVAGLPGKVEQEEKKFRLWKPNKKISGIYGDWIDGLNPPHLLSSEKDDIWFWDSRWSWFESVSRFIIHPKGIIDIQEHEALIFSL